jgi:hypothetical protein
MTITFLKNRSLTDMIGKERKLNNVKCLIKTTQDGKMEEKAKNKK